MLHTFHSFKPIIALCRCNPAHEYRPWFNWIHFFIGTFAYVLSVPTMMLGLRMPAAGLQLQFINYPLWILIFFVIFQFIIEITLEIHGCFYYRRNKSKTYVSEYYCSLFPVCFIRSHFLLDDPVTY